MELTGVKGLNRPQVSAAPPRRFDAKWGCPKPKAWEAPWQTYWMLMRFFPRWRKEPAEPKASATPFLREICGGARSRGRWGLQYRNPRKTDLTCAATPASRLFLNQHGRHNHVRRREQLITKTRSRFLFFLLRLRSRSNHRGEAEVPTRRCVWFNWLLTLVWSIENNGAISLLHPNPSLPYLPLNSKK